MHYILTKDREELTAIVGELVSHGYENSHIAPMDDAVGIATTPSCFIGDNKRQSTFTFLHPSMVCDNPHISWTFCRKECKTAEDFISKAIESCKEEKDK